MARTASALAFFGLLADFVATTPVHASPHVFVLLSLAVSASCFLAMTMRRFRPTVRFGTTVFLLINAGLLAALWQLSQHTAGSGVRWVPFREHQLGAMTVALLAPVGAWVGILTIVGFAGAAIVQYELFDPAIREYVAFGDPWATIAYGAFALVLLVYRLHANRIERESAQMKARLDQVMQFARTMLAVRDVANTPLQTLVLSVDLLRSVDPDPAAVADRIERAVRRLRDIDRIATAYEDVLDWPADAESFDALEILRRRQ